MSTNAGAIKKARRFLVRQCGTGNSCACVKAKAILASDKVFINAGSMVTFDSAANGEIGDHPNKMPFKGILLLVDQASTKPPHGSRGHRIYVPKKVAADHLEGLIGMAVNYDSNDLDSHDTQHKVGIVTKAWIQGNQVWVSGFVWKKDFPEAADDLKKKGLGMSMELANVYVRDEDEDVWHLEDFDFTGATILKKSAAAYFGTELAAQATEVARGSNKGEAMAKPITKENKGASADNTAGSGALLVEAMKGALSAAMGPVVEEIKASNSRAERLQNDLEELKGLYLISAAKEEDEDEDEMSAGRTEDEDAKAEDEDEDEMSAAKGGKKEEDDDEDDDSEGDEEDLDAMEDLSKEDPSEKPGELNKDAKNKGNKTTVTDPPTQGAKAGGGVAEGRLKSSGMRAWGKKPFPGVKSASMQAAAVQIATLVAQNRKTLKANRTLIATMQAQEQTYKKELKKLKGKVLELQAAAEKYSNSVDRRSVVPVEIRNLLAKGNVDARDILAGSVQKLPVEAVDQLFTICAEQGIQIDTTMKAAYKNRMHELGLMESGEQVYGSN